MSDPLTTASEGPADWAQALLRRQVERLDQLAETGLQLAQSIATDPSTEAAMAFSRVARAVRMTGLLQSKLIRDMAEARSREAYDRKREAEDNAEQAAEDEARLDPAYGHKARVEGIVVRVARAEGADGDRIERIVQEAGERLDDDDIYGDVLNRPVGELVALVCRDLGLEPDWERLAKEAWAQDEIKTGVVTSPFVSMTNHQAHQVHQQEGSSESADVDECAARLGALGVLGGSPLRRLQASP